MKPVCCCKIAVGGVEGLSGAPQGFWELWMQSSAVFLVVNGQRQLGLRRDQFEILQIAEAFCESGPVALARLGTANG